MAIVMVFTVVILSALFSSKIVETSANVVRGNSKNNSDLRGGKVKGPPWIIGHIWVAFLLFLFTLLGVAACFFIILGPNTNPLVLLVVTMLVVGGSYGARSHKDEIDVGDFFTCFTLGFSWPAAWPLLAQKLGAQEFLTITPILTPTPISVPNQEGLIGHLSTLISSLVQIFRTFV